MNRFRTASLLLLIVVGMLLTARAAEEHLIAIRNVRSGTAILRQQGRLTILEIKSSAGSSQRVALSHPSDYRQGANAPYETHLVAERPNHFLIFTDTFASNPGDIQGHRGASETGERFVHVVALGATPHETLSVLVDSCLLDLEPTSRSPEWIAKSDSAVFIGRIVLSFEHGTQPTAVYYVAPDGAVTPGDRSKLSETSLISVRQLPALLRMSCPRCFSTPRP